MPDRTTLTRRITLTGLGLMLLASVAVWGKTATEPEHGGVETVHVGGKLMYKYRDETGEVVFQDRPPPQYYELAPADDDPAAPVEPVPAPVVPVAVAATPETPWYQVAALWFAALASAAGGLVVLLKPHLARLRNESMLDRSLRRAGLPTFVDVEAHSGSQDRAVAQRLVRTPSGLLVLGIAQLAGTVRGAAEDRVWQQTSPHETMQMDNPLLRLQQAERVVRALAGEVPVHGRLVYTGNPRFCAPMPPKVQRLAVFRESLGYFAKGEVEARSLDAAWRTLMRFPRANKTEIRLTGGGLRGWLRRHGRVAAGAALLTLSFIPAIAAILV